MNARAHFISLYVCIEKEEVCKSLQSVSQKKLQDKEGSEMEKYFLMLNNDTASSFSCLSFFLLFLICSSRNPDRERERRLLSPLGSLLQCCQMFRQLHTGPTLKRYHQTNSFAQRLYQTSLLYYQQMSYLNWYYSSLASVKRHHLATLSFSPFLFLTARQPGKKGEGEEQ